MSSLCWCPQWLLHKMTIYVLMPDSSRQFEYSFHFPLVLLFKKPSPNTGIISKKFNLTKLSCLQFGTITFALKTYLYWTTIRLIATYFASNVEVLKIVFTEVSLANIDIIFISVFKMFLILFFIYFTDCRHYSVAKWW